MILIMNYNTVGKKKFLAILTVITSHVYWSYNLINYNFLLKWIPNYNIYYEHSKISIILLKVALCEFNIIIILI